MMLLLRCLLVVVASACGVTAVSAVETIAIHSEPPETADFVAIEGAWLGFTEFVGAPNVIHTAYISVWNNGGPVCISGWEARIHGWAASDPDSFITGVTLLPSGSVNSSTGLGYSVGTGAPQSVAAGQPVTVAQIDFFFTQAFSAGARHIGPLQGQEPPTILRCSGKLAYAAPRGLLVKSSASYGAEEYQLFAEVGVDGHPSLPIPRRNFEILAGVGTVLSVDPEVSFYGLRALAEVVIDISEFLVGSGASTVTMYTTGVIRALGSDGTSDLPFDHGEEYLLPGETVVFVGAQLPESARRATWPDRSSRFVISYARRLLEDPSVLSQECYRQDRPTYAYFDVSPEGSVDLSKMKQILVGDSVTLGFVKDEIQEYYGVE